MQNGIKPNLCSESAHRSARKTNIIACVEDFKTKCFERLRRKYLEEGSFRQERDTEVGTRRMCKGFVGKGTLSSENYLCKVLEK